MSLCKHAYRSSSRQMYLYDVVTSFYQDGLHLFWGRRGSLCRRRKRSLSQDHFLLPPSSPLSRSGRSGCRLRDDLSPAHLSGRHVERQREAAGQLHHVCGRVVWLPQLRRGLDGDSLLRRDRSGGGRRGRYSHGSGDDGLVGARYQLDLTALRHHLDSLGALNLRHHLVLDVGGGRGVGAGRALLDGEDDGAARGRGAQAGGELDHIALG